MVSQVIGEQFYDAGFIVSEAKMLRSRDAGTITNATGADLLLEAGLVVTQMPAGIVGNARMNNTGNGTIGTLSVADSAAYGLYVLTATSATSFAVAGPGNEDLAPATAGTAYSGPVDFTITAGATAFVPGDTFTLNLSRQFESWTGGAFTVLGLLFNRALIPAGSSGRVAVITRAAEVNLAELQWDAAITGAGDAVTLQDQALAALATAGIIAR
jgi:hypothetical protein